MFRMLIQPSSGACDLFVELFHGFYCSGSMCVGATLWFGCVVWYPYAGWGTSAPTHIEPDTTHDITQQISRKLLRMDVLTSETCWALNKEIIKQVTSSWSLFTQKKIFVYFEPWIRFVPGVLFWYLERPKLEADHKVTCRSELKKEYGVLQPRRQNFSGVQRDFILTQLDTCSLT